MIPTICSRLRNLFKNLKGRSHYKTNQHGFKLKPYFAGKGDVLLAVDYVHCSRLSNLIFSFQKQATLTGNTAGNHHHTYKYEPSIYFRSKCPHT